MTKRAISLSLVPFLLLFALSSCGDDDDGQAGGEADGGADSGDGTGTGDAGAEEEDAGEDGGFIFGDGGFIGELTCGDGVVDELEECDDGNFNELDGCTTLCEFTCTEDRHCDDLNDCNGVELCIDHACDDSDPELEDGEPCGNMTSMSCWKGICVEDVCGDGVQSGSEECDDGDLDPFNGCRPDCTYSCTEDDDCVGGDECAGSGTCDKSEHKCTLSALPDGTLCDGGDGWCQRGVCVPYLCGDGNQDPNEECDEGADNGKPGSGCAINCTISRCGNKIIEGGEECDDGNLDILDSCDQCRWEPAHRMTATVIVKSPPPDFCVTKANRFGEAFAGDMEIFPGMSVDVLDEFVNARVNAAIANGSGNAIFHLMDSDDPSLRTVDREITIGMYDGIPFKKWEEGPPLDFPFVLEADSVNEDRSPKKYHTIPAKQDGGGRVMSRKPAIVQLQGATGRFKMHDFMMRVVFDVSQLSAPVGPPGAAETLELPETHGMDKNLDPSDPEYLPQGVFCGAMEPEAADLPVGDIEARFCCREDGGSYTPCPGGELTPECSSSADILRYGCLVCIDPLSGVNPMEGSSCENANPDTCIQIIKPIPYDVDTDNDGENDAWSAVMLFEGKRIRMRGVSE